MEGKVKVCTTTRHQGEVTCLLFDQVLFSGSEDGSVRVSSTQIGHDTESITGYILSIAADLGR